MIFGGSQVLAQESERCDSQVCYIQITGTGFAPGYITVSAGSTVVWKNVDEKIHAINVYSADGGLLANSTLLRTGDIFQLKFDGDSLGRHEYSDAAVANMEGRVQVDPRSHSSENTVRVDFANPGAWIKSAFLSKGTITSIDMVPDQRRLDITVDAHEQDNLRIKFDRRLFDAKSPTGIDSPFHVTADGREVRYKEVFSDPAERLVSIPVPSGAKTISMTGTHASTELLGYNEASAALDDATATVSAYRQKGIVMGEADGLLLQARDAFGEGKYPFAKDLAREAQNVANTSSRTALAASKAMSEAEASIGTTKTFGIDVSDAEALLLHTKEKYAYGGYDEALNMAVQAKVAAASRGEQAMLLGVIVGSSAVAVYLYRTRRGGRAERAASPSPSPSSQIEHVPEQHVDLDRVFAEKPHLRQDDRQVLGYVVEKGGEALLADIRNNFGLPKSTAWRLVKRLEREELVEIIKFGNQNLVKCSGHSKDPEAV
jgi:plastocyanin